MRLRLIIVLWGKPHVTGTDEQQHTGGVRRGIFSSLLDCEAEIEFAIITQLCFAYSASCSANIAWYVGACVLNWFRYFDGAYFFTQLFDRNRDKNTVLFMISYVCCLFD